MWHVQLFLIPPWKSGNLHDPCSNPPTTCHAQVTHGHHIEATPPPAFAHFIRDKAAHAVATALEPLGAMANQGGPEMLQIGGKLEVPKNWKNRYPPAN